MEENPGKWGQYNKIYHIATDLYRQQKLEDNLGGKEIYEL